MNNLTITITQADIDCAKFSCTHCPIAQAIKRTLPDTEAFVTHNTTQWRSNGNLICKVMDNTPEMLQFINIFDHGGIVFPGLTFELKANNE